MDLMPEIGEADEFLNFSGTDLHAHTEFLAQHLSRVGEAIVPRRKELADLKVLIERREAWLKLAMEEHNADPTATRWQKHFNTASKISVAGQEARIALDPDIVKAQDRMRYVQNELDRLVYVLYKPLDAKKEMLQIYSGQVRTEKEAYNQQRGRGHS